MNLGTGVVRIPVGFAVVVLLFVPMAQAQKTTKFTYTFGPQAVVSITNNNGPITVKASGAMRVVVNAIFRADTVDINAQQRGNRIEFQTRAAHGGSNEIGRADYEVFIPNDACVVLSSSTGSLNADGVQGDLIFEGGAGPVTPVPVRPRIVVKKAAPTPPPSTGISIEVYQGDKKPEVVKFPEESPDTK